VASAPQSVFTMSFTEGIAASKPQQPPEDEVPDADEDDSYPPTLSAMGSAPDIDVCAAQHLVIIPEANKLLDHRH
jgi:hypothetical protein